MKLNQLSLSVMYWSTHILTYFIPILGALCLILTFLYVRRGIDRTDQRDWKAIKFPLIIALIPFVFIEYYSSYFLEFVNDLYYQPRIETLFFRSAIDFLPSIKALGLFLLSVIIFGIGLSYMGKLSAHLMKRFIIGSLIGLFIFNL